MSSNIKEAILTKEQNECVNFDSGDLLIRGVAGAGKSYIILRRAVKIYKGSQPSESIAIFTYTNALVNYSDELIKANLGEDKISVLTVDSFCLGIYRKVTGETVHIGNASEYAAIVAESVEAHQAESQIDHRFYAMNSLFFEEEFNWIREKCIKEESEYVNVDRRGRGSQVRLSQKDREMLWEIYNIYVIRAREQNYMGWPDLYMVLTDRVDSIPEAAKIDYILVDEAQDMTAGKMRVLKALARKSITIAADVAQKIYKTSFTWKEVGVDISGRSSKALSKSFRSTKQIILLAEDLMKVNRTNDKTGDYTDAVLPEIEGDKPLIVKCSSKNIENTYIAELANAYNDGKQVIGIIVRTEKETKAMERLLQDHGITSCQIVTKLKEANWSLLEPGVKIVTAHSSKGLEFDKVLIPNLNDSVYPYKIFKEEVEEMENYLKMERNLLYVAMTRARAHVVMTCQISSASRFIDEFDKEHYEVKRL